MHKFSLCVIVIIAAFSIVWHSSCHAANTSQIDGLKAQFLPKEFRNSNLTIDDVKKIYREKCKKASGGVENITLYKNIEQGLSTVVTCLSAVTNLTAIQEEIEKARPIGELDTVFHKYCTKVPAAEQCVREFNTKIQPCLTAEERNQNAILLRLATKLLGFMCTKGGDQIALFVAEEGPECLEANKEAIAHCMNSSLGSYIPRNGSMPDVFNLPEFVLAPEHCIDLERFEACTLHHLQQCQEITPANVAESVFKFIKNETSCNSWIQAKANERPILKAASARDSAPLLQAQMLALVAGSLCVILFRKLF